MNRKVNAPALPPEHNRIAKTTNQGDTKKYQTSGGTLIDKNPDL